MLWEDPSSIFTNRENIFLHFCGFNQKIYVRYCHQSENGSGKESMEITTICNDDACPIIDHTINERKHFSISAINDG